MTSRINQWYLGVHCVESHFLGGQCCVKGLKAELMLSTSNIVWSTGSHHLLCVVSYVAVKYKVYLTAFQVILDGPHEVDYVVCNGASCERMQSTQHGTSIDDDSIRYSDPWIRLDCSTWSFGFRVFRTAFDCARTAPLSSNYADGTGESL